MANHRLITPQNSCGGAAAGAVSLFLETCRQAECRAVEVAQDRDQRSRGQPWRGRAGRVRGRRKLTHRQGRRRTTGRWQMVERRLRRHLGREAGGCRVTLVFGVMDGRTAPGACAGQTRNYRAAEGTARFGRPWTGKGCRHWSSPAEGRRMPPSLNALDGRSCAACGAA